MSQREEEGEEGRKSAEEEGESERGIGSGRRKGKEKEEGGARARESENERAFMRVLLYLRSDIIMHGHGDIVIIGTQAHRHIQGKKGGHVR